MLNLEISGEEGVCAALTDLAQALPSRAAAGLTRGLGLTLESALGSVPVRTGALAGGFQLQADAQPGGASGALRNVSDHAAYVEMGTEKMPARPFLYPAYAGTRDAIIAAVGAALVEE